ncbi:MAG TPA: sugar transferase [Chitinophagaceae bacterium]|nr:sugar transferase [Chitinophagaceae bacterium]
MIVTFPIIGNFGFWTVFRIKKSKLYKSFLKLFLDFFIAFIGILLFSPILLILTLLLFIVNNGKPFFFQKRIGKNARIFNVIKFKTMSDKRNESGDLLSDADRLTSLGKLIRKTSLDEMPQLVNVIKGDMSLVGPRPLLVEYLPLYNEHQRRRHEVKPGITGWAQVNGRNAISWKQKFEFDVWYVDHLTFLLDLKILGFSVKKVLKSEGISSTTGATMEKFTGK